MLWLLEGALALALLGIGFALFLPFGDTRPGEPTNYFQLFGRSSLAWSLIPVSPSLLALVLARWRLPRIVAALTLFFYVVWFAWVVPSWFLLPAAIVQTVSIFPGYWRKDRNEGEQPRRGSLAG